MIEGATLDSATTAFAREVAALVGDAHLETAPDLAIDGMRPPLLACPADETEVARLLALAARHGRAVVPVGGGTALDLGGPPDRVDLAVATTRLNQVVQYEPADLTVTVQAGLTLGELDRLLAEHGQFLPLEAPLPEQATLGGAIATNASGPLRTGYGSARDLLLGVRFAEPNGEVVRAGARVVKNVAGYEIPKLMIGALGTLGVLTELSFKVYPRPRHPLTLLLRCRDAQSAARLGRDLIRARLAPLAADALNAAAQRRVGLAGDGWVLAVMLAGARAGRERYERELMALAAEHGANAVGRLEDTSAEAFWGGVRDLGHREPPSGTIVRCLVPPTVAGLVAAAAGALGAVVMRPTIGIVEVHVEVAAPADLASAIGGLRREALAQEGYAVVQRCPAETKALIDVWGVPERDLPVMRRLRHQFDPARTINPGRYVGRL